MGRWLIEPTTAAVAAGVTNEAHAKAGQRITIALSGTVGVGEVIEIKAKVGDTYRSEPDSTDPIDVTKKVLNAANMTRPVHGPFIVAIDKPATASAVGVRLEDT